MLTSLSIRNFILIESADLELEPGFTVITGETGAGKSILIDALLCALGERSQGELLKKGKDKGYVEAIFTVQSTLPLPEILLTEGYIDASDKETRTIIIRREFSAKGVNRSFINDSPATASMARTLGDALIDFHGQHEHQSLLKVESHVMFLDEFADTEVERSAYHQQWVLCKNLHTRLTGLVDRKDEIVRNREQVLFSLNEIEQISPKPGELEELEQSFALIKHSAFIQERLHAIHTLVYEDEQSVLMQMGKIRSMIQDLLAIDPEYAVIMDELISAQASLEEIQHFVSDKQSLESEIDPDVIQERMAKLIWLKKKYGSFDNLFATWDDLRDQASVSENIDVEIEGIERQLLEARMLLGERASRLSQKRKDAIAPLEKYIETTLQSMGIAHPTFKVQCNQFPLTTDDGNSNKAIVNRIPYLAQQNGIDSVEFMISLNSGEECKPLVKAASGGEISRIMLALQSLINEKAGVPVMIFDEIDTGISGKVARKVGIVMKTLGMNKQLIAISHSPQIASIAHHHVIVKKTMSKQSTLVSARHANEDERITEIASLLSGEQITETSLHTAKELLKGEDILKGSIS